MKQIKTIVLKINPHHRNVHKQPLGKLIHNVCSIVTSRKKNELLMNNHCFSSRFNSLLVYNISFNSFKFS